MNANNELLEGVVTQREEEGTQSQRDAHDQQYLQYREQPIDECRNKVDGPPAPGNHKVLVDQYPQVEQDIGTNQNEIELTGGEQERRFQKLFPGSIGYLHTDEQIHKTHGLPNRSTADCYRAGEEEEEG